MDYTPLIYPAMKWVIFSVIGIILGGMACWSTWHVSKWLSAICLIACLYAALFGLTAVFVKSDIQNIIFPDMNAEIYRRAIEGDKTWDSVAQAYYEKEPDKQRSIQKEIENRNQNLAEIGMAYQLYRDDLSQYQSVLLATVTAKPVILLLLLGIFSIPVLAVISSFDLERRKIGARLASEYKNRHNSYDRDMKAMESREKEMKDTITRLEKQTSKSESLLNELIKEGRELTSKIGEKKSEIANQNTVLVGLQAQITNYQNSIDEQYKQYEAAKKDELDKWASAYKESQIEKVEQELRCEMEENMKEEFRESQKNYENKLQGLKSEISRTMENVNQIKDREAEARKALGEVLKEINEKKGELEKVVKEIKEKQSEQEFF